jgi:hypothetical protein
VGVDIGADLLKGAVDAPLEIEFSSLCGHPSEGTTWPAALRR